MENFQSNRHGRRLRRKVRLTVDDIHRRTFPTKKRIDVPLHLYLQEQKESPFMCDVEIQADEIEPRKPVPKFVPPKKGFDIGIQVDETYVYNFDRDVMTIVNIIVEKSIEQAHTEVIREEVEKQLKIQKEELHLSKRKREKEIEQRILKEKAIREKKNKRKKEAKEKVKRIKSLLQKIEKYRDIGIVAKDLKTSCIKQKQYLNLHHNHDELLIQDVILPELYKNVFQKVQISRISAKIVDDLIKNACDNLQKNMENAKNEMGKLRIRLRIDGHGEIGPLILDSDRTIMDLRNEVLQWIQERPDDFPLDIPIEIDHIKIISNESEIEDVTSVKSLDTKDLIIRIEHKKLSEEKLENSCHPKETDENEEHVENI